MVSRLLRPVLHWTQETLRVAAPALAASARGTLGAALGSVLGGRDVPPPPPCAQQRRHRWASPKAFGTEQKVRGGFGVWWIVEAGVWKGGVGLDWILGSGDG
jgi:hypothetical protein